MTNFYQSILIKDLKKKKKISISKIYFIYFNNSLYNTSNIKSFIFFTTSLIKNSERESGEKKRGIVRERKYILIKDHANECPYSIN